MEQQNRNYNLDIIKIIASIFVILIHVTALFLLMPGFVNNNNYFEVSLVNGIVSTAVPLFVISMGYVSSKLNHIKNTQGYFLHIKKRFFRLIVPYFLWSFIYSFYGFLLAQLTNKDFSFVYHLKIIILGKGYFHLWYLPMAFGLAVISPFFNVIWSKIKRDWIKLIIILVLIFVSVTYRSELRSGVVFLPALAYLGFYLFGNFINKIALEGKIRDFYKILTWELLIFTILIIAFSEVYRPYGIAALSVVLFTLLISWEHKFNSINKIRIFVEASFDVYLLHAMILDVIVRLLYIQDSTLGIIIYSISTYIISLIFIRILPKLKKASIGFLGK